MSVSRSLMALVFLLWFGLVSSDTSNGTNSSQCSCGYMEPTTGELYTESIILYFNETGVDQNVFQALNYQNKNQKGWNTIFKQGALPSNVEIGNNDSLSWQNAIDGTDPSLEMYLDGFQFNHFSKGAELRSMRRDIMYGTFRASMRSAHPWVGGSAMSMYLQYNDSQQAYMDMLNMNSADDARVMQTVNGEWPSGSLGVNYSQIQKGNPPAIPPLQPWDFLDLRIDWTNSTLDFWIGNNNTRHVTKDDRTIPTVPETLHLAHWSTGDASYMQGPPINRSVANVRWIRAFFNSSLMSAADHRIYDAKCVGQDPCSIDDITLRGCSEYSPAAMIPWTPPMPNDHIRQVAGFIAAGFSFFGIAAILNAIIRRGPWHKLKRLRFPGTKRESFNALRKSLRQSMGGAHVRNVYSDSGDRPGYLDQGSETPVPGYTSPAYGYTTPSHESGTATPLPPYEGRRSSPWHSLSSSIRSKRSSHSLGGGPSSANLRSASSVQPRPGRHDVISTDALPPPREESPSPDSSFESGTNNIHVVSERSREDQQPDNRKDYEDAITQINFSCAESPSGSFKEKNQMYHDVQERQGSFTDFGDKTGVKVRHFEVPTAPQDKSVAKDLIKPAPVPDGMTGAATAEPATAQPVVAPTQPAKRIDHLAGFVVVSCIFVTLRHFSLTFWPYVTEAQGMILHFKADSWLAAILGPYLLTPFWIGPFFVTSCRFLAQRYLRTGALNDIANKMLLRAPRMLIPCFIFMALEYFLISLGLTTKLEWLPSVSYSTWPYVVPQANFGVFLNEIVELAYIIPNATPEIINHYCVGVLWTIPVQLQFSFVTLLATVMIKDVKKPWKRFLFYTLCIAAGWYATSWSSCHWLGLLLADADITFNWIKWTQARWWALYPALFLAAGIAGASPLVLLFNSEIYGWPFMAWENGIHPDPITGRPIFETVPIIWDAYPNYNEPSLAILTFSVGLQVCVELSTWVQKLLSVKIITVLHPHIMTIYLLHGFVFWSLGSYIAVALSSNDMPYWSILLITGVCCYAVIFIVTFIVTPLIEFATKGSTKNIWRWATEEPVPHRNTTAPFTKQLVLGRQMDESKAQEEDQRAPKTA